MSRCAGVKTTRRKGHVVCGADGPDGGGGGGVVKGEINELRNKRKDRRGIRTINSAIVRLRPKGNRRRELRLLKRPHQHQSRSSPIFRTKLSCSTSGGNRWMEANQTLGFINSVCDLDPRSSPLLSSPLLFPLLSLQNSRLLVDMWPLSSPLRCPTCEQSVRPSG